MNFRDEAKAKSRTFLAWKTQVFFPVGLPFSAALASAGVTINTGFLAVRACSRRCRWVAVSTSDGFCNTPVDATT